MRAWAPAAPQAVGSPPPSPPTLEPPSRALQTCLANRALCKGWTEGPYAGGLLLRAALDQQGSLDWTGEMQHTSLYIAIHCRVMPCDELCCYKWYIHIWWCQGVYSVFIMVLWIVHAHLGIMSAGVDSHSTLRYPFA